jgi:hypothetical protein
MDERRGPYRVLVGKPEGKKPLGRPSRVWEDNTKMNLQEMRWGNGLNGFSQNRDRWRAVVKAVLTLRVL